MFSFYSINAKPLKACRKKMKRQHIAMYVRFVWQQQFLEYKHAASRWVPRTPAEWRVCVLERECYLCHHECVIKLLLRKRRCATAGGPQGCDSDPLLLWRCPVQRGMERLDEELTDEDTKSRRT